MSKVPQKNTLAKREAKSRATHSGTLAIGDVRLACDVLGDGRSIIRQDALLDAIGRRSRVAHDRRDASSELPFFVAANNLKPFVSSTLEQVAKPVEYLSADRRTALVGFDSDLLVEICDVYIACSMAGKLRPQQKGIADACVLLNRGFAKKGLSTLIREATGFSGDIDAQRSRLLLEQYIAPELRQWVHTFPEEFFREVYRIHGWKWTKGAHRHPRCLGGFINRYVYERLPIGVLPELRERNPADDAGNRKHKHHQLLTGDVGHPQLRLVINDVVTLMTLSDNVGHFKTIYGARFSGQRFLAGYLLAKPRAA